MVVRAFRRIYLHDVGGEFAGARVSVWITEDGELCAEVERPKAAATSAQILARLPAKRGRSK